jgi:hypothetical protein
MAERNRAVMLDLPKNRLRCRAGTDGLNSNSKPYDCQSLLNLDNPHGRSFGVLWKDAPVSISVTIKEHGL